MAKATITVCQRFTSQLSSHIQHADILISATGNRHYPGDWIKPGAIVIDTDLAN